MVFISVSSGNKYPKIMFFILPLFFHETGLQRLRFGHVPHGWPSSGAW